MKTLLFCLLMLGGAGLNKTTINHPKPGGISILSVDPSASIIGWKAEKTTGKHNGTIKIQSGNLTLYCGQLSKGSVVMDMSSIDVADLNGSDKQKLENNLKGDNFFEADKFPLTILDIISVNHQSEAAYHFITITGNLTMHGVTKPIVFTARVAKSTRTDFIAQADLVINRLDFNIATNNVKYNTFINKEISLHVQLQATEAKEKITSL